DIFVCAFDSDHLHLPSFPTRRSSDLAILPSMDHMSLPFFLVIMPIAFASSTYFPLPDVPVLQAFAAVNPLHHLAEGLRTLLLHGRPTPHLAYAALLCVLMLAVLMPIDMRLLRKRVFGDA